MTTFPQDLHIRFKKGINVIFGGNYSGKTTIINSLRYGTFGLSWGHTTENLEKRYFASRVREIGRKSLDINIVFHIKPMTINVHRTVFSSGSAEIEANVSKGSSKSLLLSVKGIKREKQYRNALSKYMGLLNEEQLKFIPSLIFADEDRQPILWKKGLEYFVISLLTSSENITKLQWIKSQTTKAGKDLDRLQQDKERITRRKLENERNQKFLLDSLKKIKYIETDKYVKEYKKLNIGLKKCKEKFTQINNLLQAKLIERSDLLLQLSDNQKAILDLKVKSEQLEVDLLKAILNPSNPQELHFIRHLYYEKRCPFCWTDLSEDIDLRKKNKFHSKIRKLNPDQSIVP